MPRGRQVYDADTKAKILAAVQAARNSGQSFEEQHKAASDAGYKGQAASLRVMISKLGMTKRKGKRGRPKISKTAAAASNGAPISRRRGRPPGTKNKVSGGGWVGNKAAGTGLKSIDDIIQREVSSRINAAIDAAVKALQAARA